MKQAKQLNQTREIKLNKLRAKQIAINQIAYTPLFKAYLENISTPSLTTPLVKGIAMNRMTGTEQPAQILLPAT